MLIKRDFYRIAVRSRLTFLKFLSKRKKNNADSPQAVVPSEGLGLITVPDAGEGQEKTDKNADFSAFYALAELLNVSVERIKDECCLFQIRNVMKRLGKVIVRYNVTDAELSDVFLNCAALEIKELLVSPAYISACRKQVERHGLNSLYVGSVIDFPFGESTFKSKLADVKDGIAEGVDGVTVVFPAMMLDKDRRKEFKKQVAKTGRLYKKEARVALAATELSEEAVKFAFKTAEKSKIDGLIFIFGEIGEKELKDKMREINAYRGKKPVRVLGNVKTPEAVMSLIKLGVDEIFTPYADDIGKDLAERFKIKSLKLR